MIQNALEKEELWLGEKNMILCFGENYALTPKNL